MLISTRSRHAVIGIALGSVLGACGVAAAKEPSAEVKRQLFPAQNALGVDSLDQAWREAQKALALDPDVTPTHLILAEVAIRKGDLKTAKAEYQKAKDLGGADAEALAGLSLAAFGEDDLAAAETLANQAVAADKGSWVANYALGRVRVAQGKHEEAFKIFEKGKGLKTRAERADLFNAGMGLVALAENDADGAQGSFIKARALAPNTVEHTMNLASMYEATGSWGQAAIVLQQAEQKVGSSPMLTYRMGRAAENQRQFNDALKLYQKALAADSTYTPAQAAIGHLYSLDLRRNAQAIDVLSKVVAKKPTYQSRLDLGTVLTRANKGAEAVPYLEAAQKEKDTPEVKLALARAYAAGDMLDKALPLFNDVDVSNDATGADFVLVGKSLVKGKRYDEAKTFLDKAAEKDPNNSDVFYQRGLIDLGGKNYQGAIDNFQKKIDMDPKSPQAALAATNQGNAHQAMGKNRDAIASYRRATQLAPNWAPGWITLGTALASSDSVPAAQQAAERALQIDPQNVDAKQLKGLTFLQQEKYPEAISLLREVTQAKPDEVDAWVYLGQALLNSGKHAEARDTLEHALKLDPANSPAAEALKALNDAQAKH